MSNKYPVQVDKKGSVIIPAEVRRSLGIEPKSLLMLSQEGDEIHLVPAVLVPRRRVRIIPREELAQGLIDGAFTPEGIKEAIEGIKELGLDPKDFPQKHYGDSPH